MTMRTVVDLHVVPIEDLREHQPTSECWCRPTPDPESPAVFVHHSMDQREFFETGERKPC